MMYVPLLVDINSSCYKVIIYEMHIIYGIINSANYIVYEMILFMVHLTLLMECITLNKVLL